MSINTAIKVSGLTKYYKEFLAVDHINFEVKKGEIFGFLGPNGAGKTTTIRMLTGLSRPSMGKAFVFGFDINSEIVEAKRHIGIVPEFSNLYDELSAFDNLLFMMQLYGVPRSQRRKRAEELLRIFGLYERKNNSFRNFSRGMKRALTIAAALTHEPKILFLDEPTVGLDVVAARSLRNLIINLRQQGITIFLTTHYLDEADLLCDRVAILVKGQIIEIGSPSDLKAVVEEESVIEFSFEKDISYLMNDLLKYFTGVLKVSSKGNKVMISGGLSTDIYDIMIRFAKEKGIEIHSINSIKPSLEDAFLKITGLSPTVMAIEKGGK